MVSPVPGIPLENEQPTTEEAQGFRESALSTGQTLRTFGFQVIAFLLGIALAFM